MFSIMEHGLVHLRFITAQDMAQIKNWPAYVDGFAPLDYALRENGWLDEYRDKPDTWIYIAEESLQVAGFCLLSLTAAGDAEFRIAIHPRKTGMGLGRKTAMATLEKGFGELNLDKIHLYVRKSNLPAIGLYQSIGFKKFSESTHTIQGKQIECDDMALTKEEFTHFKL
jgi:diamine N-acetyltransferase